VALDAVVNGGPDRYTIDRIRCEREILTSLLEALGAEALPSEGSFVLARFDDPGFVWSSLAALGIAIRSFAGRSELDGWLRFTLPGDAAVFDRVCNALTTIVEPEALLFDLDGVLADVSRSYREAIRQTAASFGVEVTAEQITRAKAQGDANNDWRLTHRLIEAGGAEASLNEVTTRFEALYQGTDAEPGLRSAETLLVDRATLQRLAGMLPLAVVTGRPRADAERFLSEHDITDLFHTVVTMEDAAAKPDPASVRVAMERLGVRHAWLVGDTPDDIRAARSAGVLPIGVPAPGDDPALAAETLRRCGAGVILETPESILEVLP
jgi:HAD superfamily hydrolase (TIGR01548 family)